MTNTMKRLRGLKGLYKKLASLERQSADRQEMINVIIHCHVYGLDGREADIDKLMDWFSL